MASEKTIGRLSLYRRTLLRERRGEHAFVYSHQLAASSGVSAAQVRRDLMTIGYSGSPNRGYDVDELIRSIGERLDDPRGQKVVLVGLGNLGRAIVAYLSRQQPRLAVSAAFDKDPAKSGRVIQGCRCYGLEDLERVVRELDCKVGVIAVPSEAAQEAADRLVAAGVCGLLNFAPVALRVPEQIYVENLDLTMALEKVAYFARFPGALR